MRCYGKLPARADARRLSFAAYKTSTLPPPPATCDRTFGILDWGQMGNDRIGDCTCAEFGHAVMSWSMATTGKPTVIADADIVGAYSAITGFDPATGANDDGANIVDVLEHERLVGIGGNKIAAWAGLDLRQPTPVQESIYYYGGANIGVMLPRSAEEQADQGLAWTTPWFSPIVGGHCIPLLAYNTDYLYCVTWGKIQAMTWDFFFRYCDEAYVVLDPSWIGADGKSPVGLDLAALTADLSSFGAAA